MKKLRAAALILAAILLTTSLTACDAFGELLGGLMSGDAPSGRVESTEFAYDAIENSFGSVRGEYEPVVSRYSYSKLNAAQKALYDGLLEKAFDVYPEIDKDVDAYKMPAVVVDGWVMDSAEMRVAIRALSDDNPYIFWLSQAYSYELYEDENYTVVHSYSEFPSDKLSKMCGELDEALQSFYDSVPAGLSEYEREKIAHDHLIDACEYDYADKGVTQVNEENVIAHSVYGALVRHKCVCEGYGTALQLLLNGLGLECVSVTGSSYNSSGNEDEDDAELHLWNCVRLDGSWYNIDPTWDDQEQALLRYDYFNIDDELLFEDHTLSPLFSTVDPEVINEKGTQDTNIFVPECGDMKYNYHVYECPHLRSLGTDDLTDSLYRAATDKDEYFTFYVEERLDFDSVLEQMFIEQPQYFFECVSEVNDMLYDYEIDGSTMYYFYDPDRRSISVELSYY